MAQFNIFQDQTKRETGKKAQHGNIAAAKVAFRLSMRLLSFAGLRPLTEALSARVGRVRHHQVHARATFDAQDAPGPERRCGAVDSEHLLHPSRALARL